MVGHDRQSLFGRQELIRELWARWKTVITRIGDAWGRIVFSVFYFVVVTPFGLAVRFLSDPLQLKRRDDATYWQPKTPPEPNLEEARRQF
jgi:hypothetical protein